MDVRLPQPDQAERLTNPFREALRPGKPLIGIWSMLNSINASEGLGWAGFDWLLIDGEHAPITLPDAMTHLRALAPTPTVPIVRLPWNDRILLKQFLDAGARTLMLPYVQNADEARAAVDAMHYPPRGSRGVAAMHRASRYGFENDYLRNASDSLFLIVQAETAEALGNMEMIAAVDGVDAVFFGPGDLAASMGKLGQPADPEVTDAIDRATDQVRVCGKAAGVLAPTSDLAERHLRAGYDFVSVANEAALLFAAASDTARRFRELADACPAKSGV